MTQTLEADLSPSAAPAARAALLSADARERLAALARLSPAQDADWYLLRGVLWTDPDARLRAGAAARLAGGPELVVPWLRDALQDPSASVREAVLRALARQGDEEAAPLCAQIATGEPLWWLRRSATLTLATVAGARALPTLRAVLRDPFWRVRHAALQALVLLGDADPALRPAILAEPDLREADVVGDVAAQRAALQLLRARFAGEVAPLYAGLAAEGQAVEPRPSFWDEDPAVVTARLLAQPALPALELVPLLAESHAPLRQIAVARLLAEREGSSGTAVADREGSSGTAVVDREGGSGTAVVDREGGSGPAVADLQALRAALRWLDEPRRPYAAETTAALLDQLGAPAAVLAAEVLAAPASAGAAAWACRWAVATGSSALYGAIEALLIDDPRPAVRRAALQALLQRRPLPLALLREVASGALGQADPALRDLAALGLARCAAARAEVLGLPYAASGSLALRCQQVALARRAALRPLLWQAAQDPHPAPRAMAMRALARHGALSHAQRAALATDPDPWLRAAALVPPRGPRAGAPAAQYDDALLHLAAQALARDPDPGVRRAALRLLVRASGALPAALRAGCSAQAAADVDPWLRQRACDLLHPADPLALRALLRLTRDPVLAVRTTAVAALDAADDVPPELRLRQLLTQATLTPPERAAAYALVLRHRDERSRALLQAALADPGEPRLVQDQLKATALLFGLVSPVELAASLPPALSLPLAPPASAVARGPLGRTGLRVAPLLLSGAFGLPARAYAEACEAGVNGFFWEPGYRELTRFLTERRRRPQLVIVSGTFHGDAAGIERDVDTALRRLRTDHIDVFLLFWARSAARLTGEGLACLQRLKAAGKLRAIGFSTHDRGLALGALSAGAWDVIMTRHSAAHPGAEEALLPAAAAAGVGVLTFSALCYGRLLRRPLQAPADLILPTASECYRYSLAQPGVSACLSAPRRPRELRQNLEVLAQLAAGALSAERVAALRQVGGLVLAEDRRFDQLVRRGQPLPALQLQAQLCALLEAPQGSPAAPERGREGAAWWAQPARRRPGARSVSSLGATLALGGA